jgi:ferredoxin-NADP reductase
VRWSPPDQKRHRRRASRLISLAGWGIERGSTVATRLLYSSRSLEDVIYRDELDQLMKSSTMLEVMQTLTRAQPSGWTGYSRRIDTQMLREVAWPVDQRPLTFICGPTPFVETAAASLVELEHEPGPLKTERFGPTGEA